MEHPTTKNERHANYNDHASQDQATTRDHSTSSLSDLSQSPAPPSIHANEDIDDVIVVASGTTQQAVVLLEDEPVQTPAKKKRKMTGTTSKHFSPCKTAKDTSTPVATLLDAKLEPPTSITSQRRKSPRIPLEPKSNSSLPADMTSSPSIYLTPEVQTTYSRKQSLRKSTTRNSAFFTPADHPNKLFDNTDASPTKIPDTPKRRAAAGTSTCPVPPTSSQHFGLIQEKLWREPFWLIIAVTFLNKTAGRHAAPIFWDLKADYPTPEALAAADEAEIFERIQHLGLGNQRSKRLISIARAWMEQPPEKGRRHRVLHYPLPGDGKEIKKGDVVTEDSDDVAGALEIGHVPGCGPYAWDSWRIFCRDPLRGIADDYNGLGIVDQDFEPEWQRVLPLDKELRACLRWMWLREGWIWDCKSGEKRRATDEERDRAERGVMEVPDDEQKFAVAAANDVEVVLDGEVEDAEDDEADMEDNKHEEGETEEVQAKQEAVTTPRSSPRLRRSSRKTPVVKRELDVKASEDEIVVASQRRSLRKGKLV